MKTDAPATPQKRKAEDKPLDPDPIFWLRPDMPGIFPSGKLVAPCFGGSIANSKVVVVSFALVQLRLAKRLIRDRPKAAFGPSLRRPS